jgi:hypothetical protein
LFVGYRFDWHRRMRRAHVSEERQQGTEHQKDYGLWSLLREEQHARVGKWFCYVENMVGVQTDEQTKQVSGGRIKPAAEKFFATISEISEETKLYQCDQGEYGINPDDPTTNYCLENFQIEFSPAMGYFNSSVDTYNFTSSYSNFSLFGTKNFVMYRGLDFGNFFASHGRCEKLN